MNTVAMFSSNKEDWETPQPFFEELDKHFHFDIDVCAKPGNTKCGNYFTPDINGLSQSWQGMTCWMNPPYGRQIGRWVEKARDETKMGKCTVVALLPARTDTIWFHNNIYEKQGVNIRFIKGRLKFSNANHCAPFPSMVVVFRSLKITWK